MQQENGSRNRLKACEVARLRYLRYSDGESDKISVPIRIKERYLTPNSCPASIQLTGPEIQIGVWSERKNILLRIGLREWHASRLYDRTLSDMGGTAAILSVGQFEDELRPIVFEEGGDEYVEAQIFEHDYER